MSQAQLVNLAGGVVISDTAATANTIVTRDASGGIAVNIISGTSLGSTGAMTLAGLSKTASFTVDSTATFWNADATSGAVTFTLPAAVSSTGRVLIFKKVDASANAMTIDGSGAETIDGATTKATTTQYGAFRLWCDGATWWTW